MELTDSIRTWLRQTANNLKGHARRIFQAQAVAELGRGGQRLAQRELGWNRGTIHKGAVELSEGVEIPDGCRNNGAKPLEHKFPRLRQDMRDIVDEYCQADPTFRTPRLYRRLTVAEVRRRLEQDKGYARETLPSEEAIRERLNEMGYHPRRVRKTIPQKKSRRPMQSSSTSSWSTSKLTAPRPIYACRSTLKQSSSWARCHATE